MDLEIHIDNTPDFARFQCDHSPFDYHVNFKFQKVCEKNCGTSVTYYVQTKLDSDRFRCLRSWLQTDAYCIKKTLCHRQWHHLQLQLILSDFFRSIYNCTILKGLFSLNHVPRMNGFALVSLFAVQPQRYQSFVFCATKACFTAVCTRNFRLLKYLF